MFAAHLHYLLKAQLPADLDRLVGHLPRERIEQAVQETCKVSIRRRLPAEQLAWLASTLTLYRHQSKSAVTQAQQRTEQESLA